MLLSAIRFETHTDKEVSERAVWVLPFRAIKFIPYSVQEVNELEAHT
jgi:hypothetical protein